MTEDLTGVKARLHRGLAELCASGAAGLGAGAADLFDPKVQVRASHPINEGVGRAFLAEALYGPAFAAFPDLERRDLIVIGGRHDGRDYVGAMGHYCGTFRHDWLGIPATGRAAFLRYGEVFELRDGRIVQANCLWDVLDLIRQAGHWPLAPSLGAEGMWPGPLTLDGIVLAPQDPDLSARSLAQTLAMHATLHAHGDAAQGGREGLLAMPQRDHWHPRMMWYGPAGIGTARGLAGFVDHHQLPFRTAFPRPATPAEAEALAQARADMGGGHYVRIGDGPYSLTGGWPSRVDRHGGPGFLGLPATGRMVGMRVMDFYLHHEGLIRENWVPLDMLDLLMQLGVDVLARMRAAGRLAG